MNINLHIFMLRKILQRFLLTVETELYLYSRKKRIRAIVWLIEIILISYFLFLRIVVPSLFLILFFPCFVIALPGATEPSIIEGLALLNYYLSLSEQDPEWINWVQRELNERTPDAELAQRIHGFITLEESSRNAVIDAFKHLYYSSGAFPPVEPFILESSVRSLLLRSNIYFDGPALDGVYRSMIMEQGHSPFLRQVVEGNAELINAAWLEKQQEEAAAA